MSRVLAYLAAVPLLALLIAGCGGDEGGTATFSNDAIPLTFEYPSDWDESDDVSIDQELGNAADETVALGLDNDNAIILQKFTLSMEVTEENLSLAADEFEGLVQSIDPDAEAEETEVAGYPALEIASVALTTPEDGESRFTILFDGIDEYLINCQSTPDEREAVDTACDAAIESLEPVDG